MLRPAASARRTRSALLRQRAVSLLGVLGHLAALELGGRMALERALDPAVHNAFRELGAVVVEAFDGVLDPAVIGRLHRRAHIPHRLLDGRALLRRKEIAVRLELVLGGAEDAL